MNAKVIGIFLLLVGLWTFLAFTTPESFLKGNNIENLLRRTAMYGVLGIGVAFVIITSGIDLSIGSLVCLVGCLLAMFLDVSYEPFDAQPIVRAQAAGGDGPGNAIFLPSSGPPIREGDRIRYYGGRRARKLVGTVRESSEVDGQRRLLLDQAITRDDTDGYVTRLVGVASFDGCGGATGSDPRGSATAAPGQRPDLVFELGGWIQTSRHRSQRGSGRSDADRCRRHDGKH